MRSVRNRRAFPLQAAGQRGSVIIIVLWTAALLTVLVTAMAARVRLSAQTVAHNYEAATQWAELMGAVRQAEAELMLELMQRPVGEVLEETEEGEVRSPLNRFNGQPLELHYPLPGNVVVRIYNHAGKINLNLIPRANLQSLIRHRLGGEDADPDEVDALLNAWTDWTDLNELASTNGAERDYYESLEPGYAPRNNPDLDSVEELLHIRGFAELFADVNLDAAFTVYGNHRTLNLNLATREAMRLIPGMTEEIIENILAFRAREDINGRSELAEFIPFENLQEISPWIGNQNATEYSLFAYHAVEPAAENPGSGDEEEFVNPDPVTQAYSEIIQVRGFQDLPRVLKVDPYGHLPDTAPPRVAEEDLSFD